MASRFNSKEEDGHQSGSSDHGGTGDMKSKEPDNTAFKRQRLPAWRPVLTVDTLLPAYFIIGLISIGIGIGLFVSSNNIREFEIDYTGVEIDNPCYSCAKNFSWNSTEPCVCSVDFTLDQSFESTVYMYYGLSNFYQTHRRYVKSRDDSQLNSVESNLKQPSKDCEPYITSDGLPIAPCGAIANSLFNDTLQLFFITKNGTKQQLYLAKKGIAWWTDKNIKFRNPGGSRNLSAAFIGTAKPVNWRKQICELDLDDPDNNGFVNEDFIVWMRTAALPTFRKLYGIIQKKPNSTVTLSSGKYVLVVTYNYPLLGLKGRKRMILSTTSWIGGKNPFLGIGYIAVGCICFFMDVIMLIFRQKVVRRRFRECVPM